MQTTKTISQHLEHMTLFADIVIKQFVSTQETYFECIATFNDGNQVLAREGRLDSAIELLNTNMQWYVLNC